MQTIIELSITEHSLTVTKVVNLAFNKEDKVKGQNLLMHALSLLEFSYNIWTKIVGRSISSL